MAATAKLPSTTTTSFLTLALLLSLTITAATAQRHPSYNDRLVAATHLASRARARAAEDPYQNVPWAEPPGRGDADAEDLLQQMMAVEPSQLRHALLQSLSSAPALAEPSSSSSSSSSGGEAGLGAVGETPEEYYTCMNHINQTIVAVTEGQLWALRLVDAMGKPSPALSEGNFLWLGAYDMCQTIRSNFTTLPSPTNYTGKYCNGVATIPIKSPNPISPVAVLGVGLCVPDTCSEFDMTVVINTALTKLGIPLKMGVQCVPPSSPLDTKAIVAIVICSLLLALVVLGTATDVWLQHGQAWTRQVPYVSANGVTRHEEHLPLLSKPDDVVPAQPGVAARLLVAFSVYTNGAKLLATSQPKGSLTCVHGVRFLSMTWVVLGHVFLFPASLGENVGPFLMKSLDRWTFQGIANALVSVDSFFVISGLLVSYLTLKELQKKNGRLNWFMFYFHRFWRLTPAYMLVIMVYVCLSPYWGDGPLWPAANADRDNCQDNWWTNLLYINNLVRTKEMCLGQSWYLANDMQFYCVLSPMVILPLFYYPIAGYVVAAVLVLTHCVTNAALTVHNSYPPGMFARVDSDTPADMAEWGPNFYMKPYTRWGPYVIGMVAGYILYITKCKLNIRWYLNAAVWGAATAAALAVLYGLYGATSTSGHPMSVGVSAFYNAMHRNVWAVCLCWVIVACVTGNGGFVNTVLSWKGFVPLSRLTYTIYLLHILIIMLSLENARTPFYYTDINLVLLFLSVLVVSYMAAAVASLAFEAPMMALEKIIFPRDRSRDSNQPPPVQQPEQNGFYTKK